MATKSAPDEIELEDLLQRMVQHVIFQLNDAFTRQSVLDEINKMFEGSFIVDTSTNYDEFRYSVYTDEDGTKFCYDLSVSFSNGCHRYWTKREINIAQT